MKICSQANIYSFLLTARTLMPTFLFCFVLFSWVGLVTKNYEIERACAELEAEVERLKQQHQTDERWLV